MRLRDFRDLVRRSWDDARDDVVSALRDIGRVVNGGVRLRDQLGIVRELAIDCAALPVSIEIPANTKPIGVVLLRASLQTGGDGSFFSGGFIQWDLATPGVLKIRSFDSLNPSTYDCVIAVLE